MKPQIHQSMLEMLSKCGLQFQYRYGARFGIYDEEIIVPPTSALAIGDAVHRTVHENIKHIIQNGRPLPYEEIRSIAYDKMLYIWNGGLMLSEDEAINPNKTKGEISDTTVSLALLHASEVAPKLSPSATEEPFVVIIPNLPFDLAGQIDIRESIPQGNGLPPYITIWDTKTAGKTPSVDDIRSFQMGTYSLGAKVLFGKMPDKVALNFLIKKKTPKSVILEATPDESWINPVLRRIERFAEIIESVKSGKQVLTPAQTSGPSGWVCTKRYCGYYNRCPFWSGR